MPISRLEGLKGINAIARRMKGFDGLSYQQQREFLAANEAKLGAYTNNSNSFNFIKDYYDNLQFINRFGKKAFQLTGPTEEGMKFRRLKLNEGLEQERNNLINATFDSTFGNDSDIQDLRNGLDEQGKLDLLRNTNYLTDSQINDRFKQNFKNTDTVYKGLRNGSYGVSNPFSTAGSLKAASDVANKVDPYANKDKDLKNNQYILDKIFSQVQKRRENSVAGLTDTIYKGILNANNKGVKSLAQSYKDFDTLATKVSNHYAQFKDSKWLSDYSNTDKLKDYAKFMALEQKYGKGIAIQYLDHSIQNRVAKAQDGVWTGNTLKKIGTTFLSDLGSQVAMMSNADAFFNPEAMGLINQGLIPIYAKDKNGNTLHDKQGNPIIVGSKKNDNIWTNPAYWNDMYMYNTTDQHEMELIKQRGGISKYVNVNPYGYNPNEHMLSWGTAQEAAAQSGHIFASLAETALLGGIGKGIGLAGKAVGEGAMMAARAANVSAKVLNAMSKTGRVISKTSGVANDILMNMAASMNGPQGESMGTFNEQLEKNTEAVKNQIRKELNDYAKTINYNAPHAKQQIAQYFNQLKLQDQRRLRRGAIEGVKQLPMSDATLMQQAKQMYTNSLLNDQERYLEYKHNKDYQEAATNAARTYTKNWVADFIKENFITDGVQNFKIAKGALTGALDNTIAKNITADAATGGVKRVVGKAGKALAKSRWQNVVKQAGKQVAGGFADEFLDGLNANMAEGIGDKSFKDYLNKNYNPEAYNATTHGAFANMVAGIDGLIGGLTDRENWYEGFIGALSPFASGAVNAGIITNPINTTRALLKGVDENGNKLNIAERAAQVITNPILSEYANAKSEDRAIDQRVKDINELIKNNKTTLNDAAKAMMALNNYSSPLQLNRYKGEDGVGSTILDSEDNKLYNVFTLMDLMHTLHGVEGGTKSQIYQDVMGNMKNIAEGKLSEDEMNDEIDKFLADKDNKSILDKPDAREIAAERLQKNAKFFMDTYKKYDEISNTLARSSKLRNADPRLISMLKYNLLAKDNYKERLNQMEAELGVGHTDAENRDYTTNLKYLYGRKASRENALKARERDLANIEAKQKANIEANNKALVDRDNAQKEIDNAKDENARKAAQDKLDEINNLMESRRFQNKSLDTQKSILQEEKADLEQLIKDNPDTALSVDGILSMNAADRAAVLDERNKGNYTKAQLKIIERAKEKLKAKDPDALQKIHDAGILHDRIANSNTVYNKLLDNADLATTWLDAQEAIRDRRAAEENIERVLKDSYNKLDDAYDSGDAETLKKEVLGNESSVLDAYMQDNPDKADKVKPYYDMRKFFDDAAAIVFSKDGDEATKDIMLDNIAMMFHKANSVEDVMKNIEGIIDDPNMAESIKKFFDDLLNDMQKLNYQRDHTTIEKRQERLKREADEKAKRDAEKARKEAEAKAEADRIAAEKAAKEAKEKAESEAKAKAEVEAAAEKAEKERLAAEAKSTTSDEEPDNLVASGDAVPTEETLSKEEEEKERSNIENAKQKGEATPISMSWANSLMSDSAEEGSAPAGDMWHSTNAGPRKEPVTANLKINNGKRTITFTNGEQNEEIVVKPKDYEVDTSVQQSKSINNEPSKEQSEGVQLLNTKWVKIDGSGHFILNSSVTIDDLKKLSDFDKYFTIVSSEAPLQESTSFDLINSGDLNKPDDKGNRRVKRKAQIALRGKQPNKTEDYEAGAPAQQKPTEQNNKENNKEQQSKSVENRPFHAKSLEKDGDDWYFVGNFEDENKETKVKAKKDFNLDKAIDEQRAQRERLYYKQGDTVDVGIMEDSDGNTFAVGQTLEEQKNSLPEDMNGTIINGDNTDSNVELNALGESQEDDSVQQLSGYSMAIWNRESLQSEGTLVRDKDEKAPYSRDRLNDWLDAMHINLRNIIDQELFQILRANPQAKVKFMATNSKDFPVTRAFKDDTVSNNLFLVLDYDDSINPGITQIHDNDKNGGVIETGDGKKYLIIGVYAYKNGNKVQQNLYNNLWGINTRSEASLDTKSRKQKVFGATDSKAQNGDGVIRLERDAYFPSHTKERFYVSPNYSTEIVPYSLIPGWNVHRMEHDTEGKHRPVIELMQDKDRNPFGLTIENASWAIQKTNEFLVISPKDVNSEDMSIMAPTNPVGRAGASYILFPAANGRMFCGEITPCMYGDMREGSLKTRVDDLLHQLTSSDHKERVDAIIGLNRIFYFESNKNKKGKTILTNRRGQISFINEDGSTFYTTTIGDSFNMEEFIQKFKDFKPRVNITSAVLSNKDSIKEYSEAGALDTDLGQLALAGSSYGVYSVNLDGSINKPTEIKNPVAPPVSDKNYSKNFTNVFYYTDGKLATYRYDKSTGNYSLNGNLIDKATNAALIKQLDYNRQVIDRNIIYETEENGYKYYIINDADSPLVIKINSNYQVKELSPEDSKAYIDKVNKDKEAKNRETAAKQALAEMENLEDVNLGIGTELLPSIPSHQGESKGEYIDSLDNDGAHHLEYTGLKSEQRELTSKMLDDSGYLIEEVLDKDIDEIKKLNNDKETASLITKEDVLDLFTHENSWGVDSIIIHPNGDIDLVVDSGIKTYIKGDIAKELAYKLFPELNKESTNTAYPTGSGLLYNPETGGLIDIAEQEKLKKQEEAEKKKKEEQEKLQNPPKKPATKPNTQTFKQLYKNRGYKREVFSAIKAKWPDAPKGLNDLNEFLAKKNVEVDSIGTSKDDIDTWIDTLKNCK